MIKTENHERALEEQKQQTNFFEKKNKSQVYFIPNTK